MSQLTQLSAINRDSGLVFLFNSSLIKESFVDCNRLEKLFYLNSGFIKTKWFVDCYRLENPTYSQPLTSATPVP